MNHASEPKKLIRMPQVIDMTGLARSTIYAKVQAGEFPRPLKISHRHVAWKRQDIISWIEGLSLADSPTWNNQRA
jgi:prophage regulatory protein